jgi:integrase
MTELHTAIDEYLAMRRGLGFKLAAAGRWLPDFATYLHDQGSTHITVASALAWATGPAPRNPSLIATRLGTVRQFTLHHKVVDPATEVPPEDLVLAPRKRIPPHLFSRDDVAALVAATSSLQPPFRAATYAAFIGMLAVTGLRSGEALRLDRTDVDLDSGVLTVERTKFGKTREVPLHPSTVAALADYDRTRQRAFPGVPWFFANAKGTRLYAPDIYKAFAALVETTGIKANPGARRPRPHDLRHSFAVETLTGWYRDGQDVEARLPMLSTYLGHLEPAMTYWYLSATPELLALAARRLETDGQEMDGEVDR